MVPNEAKANILMGANFVYLVVATFGNRKPLLSTLLRRFKSTADDGKCSVGTASDRSDIFV